MVTNVPTFQSDRVSSIPSMGIVEQSGMRDLAGAMSETGKVWDVIGDYANQKADQFMQREMTLAAEEAVRSGGLNPADLSDPITAADQIYRQAALNTYSIELESTLNENLERIELESRYNPDGFKKKAEAYTKGIMDNAAPELKNGIGKYANSRIVSGYSALTKQLRQKIIQENAAARESALARYKADIVNGRGDPEVNLAKAISLIENDPETLTRELKDESILKFEKQVTEEVVLLDVMNNKRSIDDAVKLMGDAGIMVDVSKMQTIYSAYNTKRNFEAQQRNLEKQRQQDALTATKQNYYAALRNEDLTVEQRLAAREQAISLMERQGASQEAIYDFEKSSYKEAYGVGEDIEEITASIDYLIDIGEYSAATQMMEEASSKGAITSGTMLQKYSDIETAKSSPLTQPIIKQAVNEISATYFPDAGMAAMPGGLDQLNSDRQKEEAKAQLANKKWVENEIMRMSSQDMSPTEILHNIRTNILPNFDPKEPIASVPPVVTKYKQSLHRFKPAQFDINDPVYKDIIEEGIDSKNYQDKIKYMRQALDRHEPNIPVDEIVSHNEELMKILKYFEERQ